MNHRLLILALALSLAAAPVLAGAPDCSGISTVYNTDPDLDGELTTVRIAQGIDNPVFITHAPGDNERVFVLEQTGAIRLIKNGILQATPFMDLDPIVTGGASGERGLLGLAFDPDYQNNGYFYVYYTSILVGPLSTGDIVVARYERDGGNADLGDDSTGEIVITVPHPITNHNGGMIAFGDDGYLYIGTGDGGSGCDPGPGVGNGQNLTVTLGKLLRIDPFGTEGEAPDCPDHGGNYTIPSDNPFVDGAGGNCDEIWAYGLRNPWRWSFDRVTGALYIGDVGQDFWEEVDCAPASSTGGENYGWVNYEGTHGCPNTSCGTQMPCPPPSYLGPIREFSLSGTPCAVIGGNVYRGCRMPDLQGTYFYSDACQEFVRTFKTSSNCSATPEPDLDRYPDLNLGGALTVESIVAYGEDNRGELYMADYNGGEIFKILPNLDITELSGPNAAPLILDGSGGFSWENLQAVSGHGLRYFKVYRGDEATGPFFCIQKQLSSSQSWTGDPDTPASGEAFFYLVTAQDAALNETVAGATSGGTLRVVDPDESGCPL